MRHSIVAAAFLGAAAVVLSVGNASAEEKAKPQAREARLRVQSRLLQLAAQQQRILQVQRGGANSPVRDADANDPVERILVFSPRGPLVVELAIYVDGKPFRMAREKIVDEMMKFADKDEEGTWMEALKDPRFATTRYRYAAANAKQRQALAKRFDLNGNNKVDRYEVRRFIAQLGYGAAFNIRPSYNYRAEPDITKILDTNKDGSLTADELESAAERLKSRDADDNDLLVAAELGAGARNPYQRRLPRGGVRLPTAGRRVHQLGPTAQLSALYVELQKQYGDSKKVIAKKAFRAAPELFTRLDLNKNGILDAGEMVAFHLAKPQLKLEVRLGKDKKRGAGVSVISAAKGLKVAGKLHTMGNRASVTLPGWRFAVDVSNATRTPYNYAAYAKRYITQYDVDKNGYIDAKDIKKLGVRGRTIQAQFKRWDADSDGKVYAKEIEKYYDRIQAPQRTQVSLSSTSTGPSLFSAIDETGDKRISLREMRTAAKRLLKLDRNKDGRIDVVEMPSNASITIYRGRTNYVNYNRYRRPGTATRVTVRGPKWFHHMDKNADGDVTLREFLGTKQQFKKIDTNSDGFIELSEAKAAGK
ncbi:MAG: hypothetical protein ACE5KM_05165 [Planctomycetaceae bacterium]